MIALGRRRDPPGLVDGHEGCGWWTDHIVTVQLSADWILNRMKIVRFLEYFPVSEGSPSGV